MPAVLLARGLALRPGHRRRERFRLLDVMDQPLWQRLRAEPTLTDLSDADAPLTFTTAGGLAVSAEPTEPPTRSRGRTLATRLLGFGDVVAEVRDWEKFIRAYVVR